MISQGCGIIDAKNAQGRSLEPISGQSGGNGGNEKANSRSARDRAASLRMALEGATEAEVWDVVARLASELDAELKRQSGAIDLGVERVKRGKS